MRQRIKLDRQMSGKYTSCMDKIHKLNSLGVRELLRSPRRARQLAKRSPLFVLSRNKPVFVLLDPAWYQELLSQQEELEETARFKEALARTKFDDLISLEEVDRRING